MSRTLTTTPARDGFAMPSELEAHQCCWMLWPERPDNWRRHAQPAQRAFAAVAAAIARFEPVIVGASTAQYAAARAALAPAVSVVELSGNDAWMRDTGPTFVANRAGAVRGIHWRFNAWGGLYQDFECDQLVAQKVLELAQCERYCAPMVNEGGAIHVDGEGSALVTEQCLLNQNRNPRLNQTQIESLLRQYLGVQTIIWLGAGVIEDETSGHIDNLACFVRPGEICLTWSDDERDPQHQASLDALERLSEARDARGRRLRVHKLPHPSTLYMTRREAAGIVADGDIRPLRAGQRLAASYVNFYPANGAIVFPLFGAPTDSAARRQLRRLFPQRRIVGIAAREILLGGGGIHCITQPQPLGRTRPRSAARPAAGRAAAALRRAR